MPQKKDEQNILLIVMDSLRAKNLKCYGYYRNTCPNINSLAEQGVLFKTVYSSNNSTSPSFLSTLSGRHLLKQNKDTPFYSNEEINSFYNSGGIFLQEILKKKGYKTYCLNNLYGWQKKGFDYYLNEIDNVNLEKINSNFYLFLKKIFYYFISKYPLSYFYAKKIINRKKEGNNAKAITNNAIEIINKTKKTERFFLRVDYNNTHIPYDPGEFKNKFFSKEKTKNFFKKTYKKHENKRFSLLAKHSFKRNSTIEEVIDEYDSSIFFNDFLIGKIIKTLKQKKIYENTIIIITGDHGENLGEHNLCCNHDGLYDSSINVPLIIKAKNLLKGKVVEGLTQLVDIVPTVLELNKINYNNFLFDGKSLCPLIYDDKQIREIIFLEEIFDLKRRGIRTNKYKYIETTKIPRKIEIYDLKKDPEETLNIVNNKKLLEQLNSEFNNTIKNLKKINEKRRINKIILNK